MENVNAAWDIRLEEAEDSSYGSERQYRHRGGDEDTFLPRGYLDEEEEELPLLSWRNTSGFLLLVAGIVLTKVLIGYMTGVRGYRAIGGEFLIIPLIMVARQLILDMIDDGFFDLLLGRDDGEEEDE